MKTVRIGDVPLEWFTGVGEVRSHDKACNDLQASDLLQKSPKKEVVPFERQLILAKRKERKDQKRLEKLGINYGSKTTPMKGVSTLDLLDGRVGKRTKQVAG